MELVQNKVPSDTDSAVLRCRRLALVLDILHPLPLVDEQGLIAVHEPGEILHPLQVDRDGAVVEEESTK